MKALDALKAGLGSLDIYRYLIRPALGLVPLLGRSRLLLRLAIPVMRVGYRFARQMFVGVSDPSGALIVSTIKALGASAGVTQRLTSRYLGIYTGRAVSIHDPDNPRRPITPAELGLSCTSLEDCRRVLCEDVFGRISRTMSQGWDEVDEVVKRLEDDLSAIGNKEVRHRIVHEVLHAQILQGTSASARIEGISWRIRFNYMYTLEKLYRNVGRDLASEVGKRGYKVHEEFRVLDGFKGFDADKANEVLRKLESRLDELSRDESLRIAIGDGVRHQLWLRAFAGGIVIPTLEVTTWYLLGYDLYGTLEEYEGAGLFDSEFHSSIALELIDILEKRRPERSRVVEATKATLDFPPATYESLKWKIEGLTGMENVVEHFKSVVRDRFEKALNGVQIERAPPKYKTLLSVILYAITVEKIPDLVHMFVEILNSEPEVKNGILGVVRREAGRPAGAYTSFFVNISAGGRTETIAYDPLSGFFCGSGKSESDVIGVYVRRTGLRFGTFEDLVGDLPLALRGFLSALYLLEAYRDEKRWAELVTRYVGVHEERVDRLIDIAKRVREADLDGLTREPNHQVVGRILELFLYSVLRLGEDVKNFGGLHGLWFL